LIQLSLSLMLVFGTHFATPSAGKVVGKGKHFQFEL
jgi:hypothetical protein